MIDSGASPSTDSSALDTAIDDSGALDAGAADTGVSGSVDTGALDSGAVVVDSGPADTGAADTGTPDTGMFDTGLVDTGPEDTGAPDTYVADTYVADTYVADTYVEDTYVADTYLADTATEDAPGEVGDGSSGPPSCPSARGSAMVRVSGATATGVSYSFCVDKTEVTNAQYAEFLAAAPDTAGQPAECTNAGVVNGYTPAAGWPAAAGSENRPVVHVDWCDATAYCKWAGKRLCGKIGGGAFSASTTENSDVSVSEWANVCREGTTTNNYAYGGTTYIATACQTNGRTPASTIDVGSLATCEGGYPGVFDMNGNVYEWLNSCLVGATGNCVIAGGSFKSGSFGANCTQKATKARNVAADDTGIRCCAD